MSIWKAIAQEKDVLLLQGQLGTLSTRVNGIPLRLSMSGNGLVLGSSSHSCCTLEALVHFITILCQKQIVPTVIKCSSTLLSIFLHSRLICSAQTYRLTITYSYFCLHASAMLSKWLHNSSQRVNLPARRGDHHGARSESDALRAGCCINVTVALRQLRMRSGFTACRGRAAGVVSLQINICGWAVSNFLQIFVIMVFKSTQGCSWLQFLGNLFRCPLLWLVLQLWKIFNGGANMDVSS